MSNADIFFLDEDDDKDASSSSAASASRDPLPPPSTSPPVAPASSSSSTAANAGSLHIPSTPSTLLPQPQPFGRKSGVFGATPSFPSPLAQAITVPSHSDSSSSSHSSPHQSDDETDIGPVPPVSETPKPRSDSAASSKGPSPASPAESGALQSSSSRRPLSRPPTPPQSRQALTPGALLISRARRSGSGSTSVAAGAGGSNGPGTKSSPPRPASARPSTSSHARADSWRDVSPSHSLAGSTSGSSRGTVSEMLKADGSSPLAFGSPELEPRPELAAPRPMSVASPSPTRERDANILGLGWAPNWDVPDSSAGSKAKVKDPWRQPSSRRDLASPIPLSSAPRQRRASEFLRPASMDLRKPPPPSPTTNRLVTAALPTLSSSASMVSPLNPLPSPWSEVPLGQALTSAELSSSTTSASGAAIRVNKVPTSVRLAADLIRTTQSHTPPLQIGETPSSTATVPTPNPSPADSDVQVGVKAMRNHAMGHAASLPTGPLNPSASPTNQRWSTLDIADFSSLSPQSSLSVSSGVSTAGHAPPALSSTRPTSTDMTKGWVDSLPHPVTSPPTKSGSPSPVHTLSPASVAGSPSMIEDSPAVAGVERATTITGFPGVPVQSRLRSVGERGGLAMDLAGVSSAIGDAASHATMIMQSRQAKVQRWRPRGSIGSAPFGIPDANPSSRLSASFVDQPGMSRWGGLASGPLSNHHPRTGSSTLPSTAQGRYEMPGLHPIDHPRRPPQEPVFGGVEMEKQLSATGSIAGIEWVDWYDCYKAYKAEKIRAEATAKAGQARKDSDPSSSPVKAAPVPPNERDDETASSTVFGEHSTLTPVTSREDISSSLHPSVSGSISLRRRSLSIRSTISAIDHKRSPGPKRSGILERPRQSSGGSARSSTADDSQSSVLRRKKNLVTKMEGWWNAVKSNFNHEQASPPLRHGSHPAAGITHAPSAPGSRRGSNKSAKTMLDSGLLAPQPVRRVSSNSSHSIRGELYPEEKTHAAPVPLHSALHPTASLPPPPPAHFDATRPPPRETLIRRGLESRRNQPSLRLDLEPASLALPRMERLGSEATVQQSYVSPHSTHRSDSGSSSFGSSMIPGITKWDQTPAPVPTTAALHEPLPLAKDDKPVAPGAGVTVASVRQHVKQRLEAAKVQCDNTLRKIIATISVFEEERLATEVINEHRRDYFEAFSDSPIVDAADSEDDCTIPPIGSFSSRGPSRRGSISMSANVLSSPSRRVAMLSNVPSSPRRSMSRRRPSIVPRVLARDIQATSRLYVDPTTHSTSSSRSTSRSRSPMPHTRSIVSTQAGMEEALETDNQFLAALQELIVLATDVVDTSVQSLISHPARCGDVIKKLQKTGQQWDEHQDWPGRDWYVDILMAVASLSRVLDWWEAEKGFWNFDDDENEPLEFVMRPFKDTPQFDLGVAGAAGAGGTESLARSETHSVATSPLVLPSAGPSSSANVLALSTLSPLEDGGVPSEAAAAAAESAAAADETTQAIEDLRTLAEQAKNINIVMELSLQGQEILYVNDAIYEVVGWEPENVLDSPISDLLAPADTSHFADATERLLEDEGNTVELRFRFEVHDVDPPEGHEPGPVYIELEGVGMVIRENNEPSHTMWVMKPVAACSVDNIADVVFPREGNISTECVLCRICEREIVVWFFEKHNETCDAVHRLDAEIAESTEHLNELYQTLQKLVVDMEAFSHENQGQGVLFFTLPDCVTNSAEDLAGPQGIELRKVDMDDVREVVEVLEIARQIETPSVQEEEADLPFTLQRYLSRESEDRLNLITRWAKPAATTDRIMGLLFSHVEDRLRRKQKAIARMQSTIRYSEKTRHEWEDKVDRILAESDDCTASESGSDAPSGGSPVDATPALLPVAEQTSPGHRKIAPLARLPITQGHPHRPGASLYASAASVPTTSAQTPVPRSDFALSTVVPTPVATRTASTAPISTGTPATLTVPLEPPGLGLGSSQPMPSPGSADQSPKARSRMLDGSPSRKRSPSTARSRMLDDSPSRQRSPSKARSPERPERPKGHSRRISTAIRDVPVSPRITSAGAAACVRPAQPSIKDFKIIKPISRGAFGSVYLAKKVATGDYYAIKALKKSDMIAKNQITNVKAERTILMNQATSPHVVKLFFSFQSKDYLYLVMEYLNGGDCSTLVKTLGSLPVDWARNYIGELVLGLEYLHARNVAHRDIKPDNLLIDARGHLKLTDFGLSKIGLLNRQIGGPRPPYLKGTSLRSSAALRRASSVSSSDSPMLSPELIPVIAQSNLSQSYFPQVSESGSADESSGSDSNGLLPRHLQHGTKSDTGTPPNASHEPPRFVGTPDYLAPESILGGSASDRMVDWWAVGVVLYEFLYGFPPFHAETPEKVFDNVVSRRINWHEDEIDVPPEAHDLMDRLMCTNPAQRLGARGADEVKQHAFFAGVNWDTLTQTPAVFVPDGTDPESTDYFDQRGANSAFHDDEVSPKVVQSGGGGGETAAQTSNGPVVTPGGTELQHEHAQSDDFGTFTFKNLPVLKQANDDVIRKMRSQTLAAGGSTASVIEVLPKAPKIKSGSRMNLPPSPSTSTSSVASTPSRATAPINFHTRRPSELNALERVKSTDDEGGIRRYSSARFRAGSGSSTSMSETNYGGGMDLWKHQRRRTGSGTPPETVQLVAATAADAADGLGTNHHQTAQQSLTVLIAEDNPITQKILETLLTRLGCRCICVRNGPDALAVSGNLKFDAIFLDMHMPFVSGEQVARMIRSTTNPNQNSPIIAATALDETMTEQGTLFSAVITKPFSKVDLLRCLRKVGFITSSSAAVSKGAAPASVLV